MTGVTAQLDERFFSHGHSHDHHHHHYHHHHGHRPFIPHGRPPFGSGPHRPGHFGHNTVPFGGNAGQFGNGAFANNGGQLAPSGFNGGPNVPGVAGAPNNIPANSRGFIKSQSFVEGKTC